MHPKTLAQKQNKSKTCIPFKGVLALCSEKVNVRLELQLEDVLLVNAVRLLRGADCVAEQRETGQWEVVLQDAQALTVNYAFSPQICVCAERINTALRMHGWAYLVGLVEEQAEVGENNPEFLPAIAVLELPQEVT